jgi:NitT/TauT family transport system permease protein
MTERDRGVLYKIGLPVLGFAVFIGAWWLAIIVFGVGRFLLPTPLDIVRAFRVEHTLLLKEAWVTLTETAIGFGIAAAGGLLLAVILTASRLVNRAAMPVVVAINAVPKLAVAPLLVVWMGFGQLPKIVMVILICFFPVVLGSIAGLTATPGDLGELARSLTASRWKTFVKIRLPWALPHIFVGLKVSVSLAVIGAVVAEIAGAAEGLGFVIVSSGPQGDTSLAFAAVTLLAIESIALFYLVSTIERLLLPWARETTA